MAKNKSLKPTTMTPRALERVIKDAGYIVTKGVVAHVDGSPARDGQGRTVSIPNKSTIPIPIVRNVYTALNMI